MKFLFFKRNKRVKQTNRFYKVSVKQFCKDFADTFGLDPFDTIIQDIYNDIKKPKRGTRKSAGYDFFSPIHFSLDPGQSIKIPTGIRVRLKDDRFLMCAPRSGHGFKYKVQLDNTVGVIDADYIESSNEGHIFVKLTNDGREGKRLSVSAGEGFVQGIILRYDTTEEDCSTEQRDGGFGSTTK